MTKRAYEIRVVGSLGPAGRQAFADMAVDVEPTTTVLSGELDQGDLHALLDRVRALGLQLVDVKHVPPPPRAGTEPGTEAGTESGTESGTAPAEA